MRKYSNSNLILMALLLLRFIANGLVFLDSFNLRILLYLLLFTASILGILFQKRWSYLLSAGTAVSEFSVTSVIYMLIPLQLGTLLMDMLIVIFAIYGFYKFEKPKSRRRRR